MIVLKKSIVLFLNVQYLIQRERKVIMEQYPHMFQFVCLQQIQHLIQNKQHHAARRSLLSNDTITSFGLNIFSSSSFYAIEIRIRCLALIDTFLRTDF